MIRRPKPLALLLKNSTLTAHLRLGLHQFIRVFRRILKRHQLTVQTPYGDAEVKVCEVPDQEGVFHTRFYPEYETVKRLAKEHNLDLPGLYRLVQNAAENA